MTKPAMNLINQLYSGLVKQQQPDLLLTPDWSDKQVRVRIDNVNAHTCRPQQVELFRLRIPPQAKVYLEGFQMLAQSYGPLSKLDAVGRCPDAEHYRLYQTGETIRAYGMIIYQMDQSYHLLGFSSCQRFSGFFQLSAKGKLSVAIDTECLALAAKEYWLSESLVGIEADNLQDLYQQFNEAIQQQHPRLKWSQSMRGWCSWYHYYADISQQDIEENLQVMRQSQTALDYVLIDDGYQAYMGDWLRPATRFSAGVAGLCQSILKAGKQPALWLAPFIAQAESQLFQQHPDWFVHDHRGQPLAAEQVTYGGWRCTPWYVLDTSQDVVCDYLRLVFSTMFQQWGVKYFKLDALYWGTLAKGQRKDPNCSRIQAYRKGMQAILDATEGKAFILGCNAAIWPSLGLVHGMRVADDVERNPQRFKQISREIFFRSWQHQNLWLNDPDCITLANITGQHCEPQAYNWHRCTLLASSGLMFSGDRLLNLSRQQQQTLSFLLNNKAESAQFDDLSFSFAKQYQAQTLRRLYWFNWQAEAIDIQYPLTEPTWRVLWCDQQTKAEFVEQQLKLTLPAGSAIVLSCERLSDDFNT